MTATNRAAADALRALGAGAVGACTDVTGFGLLGHACEMAEGSGVTIEIEPGAVPLLPDVLALGPRNRPGGAATNEAWFAPRVSRVGTIDRPLEAVLYDPQTSGGLLAAIGSAHVDEALASLARRGVAARRIGRVLPRGEAPVVLP
jgi:selenide,water dikinase